MVTFEAERLPMTVAPARAAKQEGGMGTHTSSHISRKKQKWGIWGASKSRSDPKGILSCPQRLTVEDSDSSAGLNWRHS